MVNSIGYLNFIFITVHVLVLPQDDSDDLELGPDECRLCADGGIRENDDGAPPRITASNGDVLTCVGDHEICLDCGENVPVCPACTLVVHMDLVIIVV